MNATDPQLAALQAESRWAAFDARIHASLDRLRQSGEPVTLFALVDTRGRPELRAALDRLHSVPFAALWDGTDLAAHQDISPLLIDVDPDADDAGATQALLGRLWRFSEDGFMVTWIWSAHGLADIAQHLRGYCEYTLPDRRTFYLHFYDNRILERLREVWTQDEWSGFAGFAHELWYRQRSGEPASWSPDAAAPEVPKAAPQAMTSEQHSALIALGYGDKLAMQLREIYGPRLEHLAPEPLHLAVEAQVERATAYGIEDEADMLRYVAKGLLVSPRFDEHPAIRKGLQSARYGDLAFAQVLSQVDDILGDGHSGQEGRA